MIRLAKREEQIRQTASPVKKALLHARQFVDEFS
jgi:hypothetical protein